MGVSVINFCRGKIYKVINLICLGEENISSFLSFRNSNSKYKCKYFELPQIENINLFPFDILKCHILQVAGPWKRRWPAFFALLSMTVVNYVSQFSTSSFSHFRRVKEQKISNDKEKSAH